MMDRREFLRRTTASGAGLILPGVASANTNKRMEVIKHARANVQKMIDDGRSPNLLLVAEITYERDGNTETSYLLGERHILRPGEFHYVKVEGPIYSHMGGCNVAIEANRPQKPTLEMKLAQEMFLAQLPFYELAGRNKDSAKYLAIHWDSLPNLQCSDRTVFHPLEDIDAVFAAMPDPAKEQMVEVHGETMAKPWIAYEDAFSEFEIHDQASAREFLRQKRERSGPLWRFLNGRDDHLAPNYSALIPQRLEEKKELEQLLGKDLGAPKYQDQVKKFLGEKYYDPKNPAANGAKLTTMYEAGWGVWGIVGNTHFDAIVEQVKKDHGENVSVVIYGPWGYKEAREQQAWLLEEQSRMMASGVKHMPAKEYAAMVAANPHNQPMIYTGHVEPIIRKAA